MTHPIGKPSKSQDTQQPSQPAAKVFAILFCVIAGAVITGGAWTIWGLNAKVQSQGGEFQVGKMLLVAVALTTIAGLAIAIWMVGRKGRAQERNQGVLRAVATTEHVLARALQVLLGIAAGGLIAGGIWMIIHMDISSRSQAGGVFLGIGIFIALAGIAGAYISLEMRLRK